MSRCRYCARKKQAVLDIPVAVRWQVRHRLTQLSIPSFCEKDGSLIVEVDNGVEIAQVHSVVRQIVGPRSVMVDWLETCWAKTGIRRVS